MRDPAMCFSCSSELVRHENINVLSDGNTVTQAWIIFSQALQKHIVIKDNQVVFLFFFLFSPWKSWARAALWCLIFFSGFIPRSGRGPRLETYMPNWLLSKWVRNKSVRWKDRSELDWVSSDVGLCAVMSQLRRKNEPRANSWLTTCSISSFCSLDTGAEWDNVESEPKWVSFTGCLGFQWGCFGRYVKIFQTATISLVTADIIVPNIKSPV